MDTPILLTQHKLLIPINKALGQLKRVSQSQEHVGNHAVLREGLFVLAIATLEVAISDTIKIIYKRIPAKLEAAAIDKIPKEVLLNGDALAYVIERNVEGKTYRNIQENLEHFAKVTGISCALDKPILNAIIEAKATRNLLLHNDLRANNRYNETAGPAKRAPNAAGYLDIDASYLESVTKVVLETLTLFKTRLFEKYSEFTYLKAMRNLWNYLFNSPVLDFDEVWEITNNDRLKKYVGPIDKATLSRTEIMFLNIWLTHQSMSTPTFEMPSIYHLDNKSRRKLAYLYGVIEILKENQYGKA